IYQLRGGGPGGGGALAGDVVPAEPPDRGAPPGVPHRHPAADQRAHRTGEEHLSGRCLRRVRAVRHVPAPDQRVLGRRDRDPARRGPVLPGDLHPARPAGRAPRTEGGVRPMSSSGPVLYDVAGPEERARERRISIVLALVLVVLGGGLIVLLARNGAFDDRWLVLVDVPPNFAGYETQHVWHAVFRGLLNTLIAAA